MTTTDTTAGSGPVLSDCCSQPLTAPGGPECVHPERCEPSTCGGTCLRCGRGDNPEGGEYVVFSCPHCRSRTYTCTDDGNHGCSWCGLRAWEADEGAVPVTIHES
ncbi:hypothetical protein RM572_00300 [Streptomyces sp. DSM 42041]|uniref:Uncharacterized protein n=1 Tax=Streptomyces hazeniae TaxID=3075538 RepID=A0ABU2NJP8_9ACTN|nr:hypothetical protein [Streptomyces sp. DSM 42041]MDT0377216.1 hypothetical protein [Streptomyces sp. DSM 42041]